MQPETTRSLVIGLFVLTGRPELSARELVQLAHSRGATASNVKSHLTRMVQDGSLVRTGTPRDFRYAPSPHRQRIVAAVHARLDTTDAAWDGTWILLATPRTDPRTRRRLVFDGFRTIGRGAHARPAWPEPWATDRATAHAERTGGGFVTGPLTGERALAACLRAYALPRLAQRAASLATRVARAQAAPPTGARALALRLEIGERIARLFAADPRLPPVLWGGRDPLRDLARAHARLERVLTRASASFLATVLAPLSPRHRSRTA